MARRKALWEDNYLVWGQSNKTGRKYKIQTRCDRHVRKLIVNSSKVAVIASNSICISLIERKEITQEDVQREWEIIKAFWNKMKGKSL